MMQADSPDDYVLSTGTACSVRDFVEASFTHVGLDWEKHVRFDERYHGRPRSLRWTSPG